MTDKVKEIDYDHCLNMEEKYPDLRQFLGIDEEELKKEVNIATKKRDMKTLWAGMPEYDNQVELPWKQMTMNFKNEEDFNEFAKLLGQKLTSKTRSAWYPYKEREVLNILKWVDAD